MKNKFTEKQQAKLEGIRHQFPFKSRYIKLKHPQTGGQHESTIHYVDEGKGEPIVFVHGNPTWSFYFRKVIEPLRSEFRCIAFDQLGCGLSEKDASLEYRLEDRSELIRVLLDEIGVTKCHLVVHDWGGAVAMGFAVKHPERVASVVVTNTAAFTSDWISWRINLCRLPVLGRFINYHLNGFLRAAMLMTTKEKLSKDAKTGYLLPYKKLKSRESIDQFVKDIPMKSSHPSWNALNQTGESLRRFKDEQFLILWGMRDFCFSPYFFEKWKEIFPSAHHVGFEDADHFLFEEKEKECVLEMQKHFRKNKIS